MKWFMILVLVAGLTSCLDKKEVVISENGHEIEETTVDDADKIFTYEINGRHVIIGAGAWDTEGKFIILSVDGREIEVPSNARIERSEPVREDIGRQTRERE